MGGARHGMTEVWNGKGTKMQHPEMSPSQAPPGMFAGLPTPLLNQLPGVHARDGRGDWGGCLLYTSDAADDM
eukprot:4248660-Alexandrium_andersonii.AAC.1